MSPTFIYGTAWKEDQTRRLVEAALRAGFRAIDTANQRKHYYEAAVGEALRAAGMPPRAQLFLQTKFTFVDGQDERLPYEKNAPIATQVAQSFASSLTHLGTAYVDSYVLHGPSRRVGLGPSDWEAWGAMESLFGAGKARSLGVSNVNRPQLEELVAKARVRPSWVQNRCYASKGWDAEVRMFCEANGLRYQGFSLLTANTHVLKNAQVVAIAARLGKTPAQVVFRFALQVGMTPLTGTSDVKHMQEDLAAEHFSLEDEDLALIERVSE